MNKAFPDELQRKIDYYQTFASPIKLGNVHFASPLILAPMASITNAPFRLLMEDLGAGGTVSELVSCHGINYQNQKTLDMLRIDAREKNVGLQLFGEDPQAMAHAAKIAEQYNPKFIDINMGCPVRKVVTKGGGSALLKDIESLAPFLAQIKKAINIPLTIKIRMGWDAEDINADKIIQTAKNEGVEFVAIHGRTRAQQYTGKADWDYIETLAYHSPLPLIGNGDLHTALTTFERMQKTTCQALMIARGCLRNPFIFLESLNPQAPSEYHFRAADYWPVIERLYDYTNLYVARERTRIVQMRKLIVWFATGLKGAAQFRSQIFPTKELDEVMRLSYEFFHREGLGIKDIDYSESFMSSGHG